MKGECGRPAMRHRASPVVSTTTAKWFMAPVIRFSEVLPGHHL